MKKIKLEEKRTDLCTERKQAKICVQTKYHNTCKVGDK